MRAVPPQGPTSATNYCPRGWDHNEGCPAQPQAGGERLLPTLVRPPHDSTLACCSTAAQLMRFERRMPYPVPAGDEHDVRRWDLGLPTLRQDCAPPSAVEHHVATCNAETHVGQVAVPNSCGRRTGQGGGAARELRGPKARRSEGHERDGAPQRHGSHGLGRADRQAGRHADWDAQAHLRRSSQRSAGLMSASL